MAIYIKEGEIIEGKKADVIARRAEWKDKYLVTHVIYRLQKTFCPDLDYGLYQRKY